MAPKFNPFETKVDNETYLRDLIDIHASDIGLLTVGKAAELVTPGAEPIVTPERFGAELNVLTGMLEPGSADIAMRHLSSLAVFSPAAYRQAQRSWGRLRPAGMPALTNTSVLHELVDSSVDLHTNQHIHVFNLASATYQATRFIQRGGKLPSNYEEVLNVHGYRIAKKGLIMRVPKNGRDLSSLLERYHVEEPEEQMGRLAMNVAFEIDRFVIANGINALSDMSNAERKRFGIERFRTSIIDGLEEATAQAYAGTDHDTTGAELLQRLSKKFEDIERLKKGKVQAASMHMKDITDDWIRSRSILQQALRPSGLMLPLREEVASTETAPVVLPPLALTGVVELQPDTPAVVETNDTTAETIALLLNELEQHDQAYGEFMEPYQASTKALKAAGLHGLLHDLRVGYRPDMAAEDEYFEGVNRVTAHFLLEVLMGLRTQLSGWDNDAAREKLQTSLTDELQLQTNILETRAKLKELGINGYDALSLRLADSVEWFYNNGSTFRKLLSERCPDIAEDYRKILDLISEPDNFVEPGSDAIEPEAAIYLEDPQTNEAEAASGAEEAPQPFDEGMILELGNTHEVAEQLDWVILPPADQLTVERIKAELNGSLQDYDKTDWKRIEDLITLAQTFQGTLYRSKPRTLAAQPPYFVAEIELHGTTYAIAENATHGNATYIVGEHLSDGPWRDVLAEAKRDARIFGARKVVHPTEEHVAEGRQIDRILTVLQDMALVRSNQR
jgi:hypothetical protein